MCDNISPDSPCFCGSGKKYRFCCQPKNNNSLAPSANRKRPVVSGDLKEKESGRLHEKGLKYMQRGQFEQAIKWFARALEANRAVCSSANNLALCLFLTGKTEEAIQVQRQNFEDSPLPNPFGNANLSMFLLFLR